MKICYKVVREEENGKYYSAVLENLRLRIEYPPNEWIKSRVGRIFVFETKEQAIEFAESRFYASYERYRVFKVQAIGVKKAKQCLPEFHNNYQDIKDFWANEKDWQGVKVMPGTLFAKKIKLIEEVKWNAIG